MTSGISFFLTFGTVRQLKFNFTHIRYTDKQSQAHTRTHAHARARRLLKVHAHTVLNLSALPTSLRGGGVQWNRCAAPTAAAAVVCATYIEVHRQNETKWWCARNIDASDNTSDQHFTFYGWKILLGLTVALPLSGYWIQFLFFRFLCKENFLQWTKFIFCLSKFNWLKIHWNEKNIRYF